MSSVRELNEQLSAGILPEELQFSKKKEFVLDLNKIKYNAFYRSYEFYEKKFPDGVYSLPGFDKIIDGIVYEAEIRKKTPLDELDELEREIKEIQKEIQEKSEFWIKIRVLLT